YVTQVGVRVWVSKPGIQSALIVGYTFHPHESLTLSAVWDGQSNLTFNGTETPLAQPTGLFVVNSPVEGAVPVTIDVEPTLPPPATPSDLAVTLTTDRLV